MTANWLAGDFFADTVGSISLSSPSGSSGFSCLKTNAVTAWSKGGQGLVLYPSSVTRGTAASFPGMGGNVVLVNFDVNSFLKTGGIIGDLFLYNSTISNLDYTSGIIGKIHLFNNSNIGSLKASIAGNIYLHDSSSVSTVNVTSGGAKIDCSTQACP